MLFRSNSTGATCSGGNNGQADVTVSGGTAPYTYSWSNGATTEDLSGVTAGNYTLTVTDAKNCTATLTVTITQAPQLIATANFNPINCNGGTTVITVGATGGTQPYSGTGTFTVSAGTYTYTVVDNAGCNSSVVATVSQPTALTATVSSTNNSCSEIGRAHV